MTQDEDRGHYVAYVRKDFRADALATIAAANEIIREYEAKGFALTLRQLYYQFVARGKMENVIANYNRLGALISDGRLAGLVSWTAIEDRGRNLMGHQTFASPEAAVRWLRETRYRTDLWADQPFRPEVWVEKQALEGVVGAICSDLRVDFFATRGYNSQSEQWRAGRRFAGYVAKGQRPIVFQLGDHDPSGIDMTRDNRDRLALFCGVPVQVVRLALNMPQVEALRPPPNPAKTTDSRYADYAARYGDESWELDALDPVFIRQLIEEAVLRVRDPARWDAALKVEADDKDYLEATFEDHGEGGDDDDE
jgi:hypothetical protein